ncbi:MAG TPA: sugar phosphate isomerase/epimerase family protein [Gaiellaceae bacterium]|nr:sugar phosphate isomerase/epimerase family protein [Gaiellaceae bacterium]
MNPVGANTWIWQSPLDDAALGPLVARVGELGFDSIELPIEELGGYDPRLAAELIAAQGLGVSICAAFPPGRDLLADAEVVASTQAFLRGCIDVAVTVGARVVGGPMTAAVGRVWRLEPGERPALLARLAQALLPVADYAGEAGVRLALEPLNRYETSVVNTAEQALEVLAAVDSPVLGVLLDTYHMNIEEKHPADAIRLAGTHLLHVHASASDRGAPGADHVDWRVLAEALAEVDYGGTLCIEAFTPLQPGIATAAYIWRPVAASQDALAAHGLAFLREVLADVGPRA